METNPEFWSHRPLVEPVLPPYWSCWREAAERKELLLLPTSQTPNSSGTRTSPERSSKLIERSR